MKQFAYPAICYYDADNETTTLLLPDTDIIASGENVEEAFWSAKNYLKSFIDWSIKFDAEIPQPTKYSEIVKANSRKSVLLIDTESKAKLADIEKAEQKFQGFIHDFFE